MFVKVSSFIFAFLTQSILFNFSTLAQVESQQVSISSTTTNIGKTASCSVGTVDGSFNADAFGQANYNIPISVPPGVAGLDPSLSFHYNSMLPNEQLGVGWSISGTSKITRCSRTQLQDGSPGSVQFDSNDAYCLDGQRLVAGKGYGLPNTVYRTNPDKFTQVISHGSTTGNYFGPKYFMAYDKSGLVYEYAGNQNNDFGRIEAVGLPGSPTGSDTPIRVWAISRIIDRSGNFIQFNYSETPSGEYALINVSYTGFCNWSYTNGLPTSCTAQSPGTNLIRFIYNNRPDLEKHYQGGAVVENSVLLSSVFVNNASGLVTKYNLSYELSSVTRRSRLKSITQCDPFGVCLPASNFFWSDPVGSSMGENYRGKRGQGFGGRTEVKGYARFDDSWGFGFPIGIGISHQYSSSQNSTAVMINAGVSYRFSFTQKKTEVLQAQLGDFNGDGKSDVIQFAQNTNKDAYVWFSDGENFVSQSNSWGSGFGVLWQDKVGDFNGDGKSDVVQLGYSPSGDPTGTFHTWLSDGAQFVSQGQQGTGTGDPSNVVLADVNGDGRTDILKFPQDGSNGGASVWLATGVSGVGNGFTWAGVWQDQFVSFPPADRIQLGDINGDGRMDVISHNYASGVGSVINFYESTGSNFVWRGIINIPTGASDAVMQVGDFNGDRLADAILFQYSGGATTTDIFYTIGNYSPGSPGVIRVTLPYDIKAFAFAPDVNPFRARTSDFNGDGKTDILIFKTNGEGILYLSRGFYFDSLTWTGSNKFLAEMSDYAIADVNGDGRSDVLEFSRDVSNSVYVWKSDLTPYPDKMTGVRNGYGMNRYFSYTPISDDSIYTEDNISLTSYEPLSRRARGPWYVLTNSAMSNGSDGQYQTTYGYQGAKSNISRGFLGFSSITVNDPQRRHRAQRSYYQNFPLTSSIYSDLFFADVLGNGSYSLISSLTRAWQSSFDSLLNKYTIRPKNLVESSYETNGTQTSIKSTGLSYDAAENVTKIVESWPTRSQTNTTSIKYYNDYASWGLGFPMVVAKVSSSPGQTSKVRNLLKTWNFQRMLPLKSILNWNRINQAYNVQEDLSYDVRGNVISNSIQGTGVLPRTINYAYDSNNQFIDSITHSAGHTAQVDYDPRFGKPTKFVEPGGLTSTIQYDYFGRDVLLTNPWGVSTSINYCPIVSTSELPNGATHSVSIIEQGSPEKRIHFDMFGKDLRRVTKSFTGGLIYEDFSYDQNYRLISRTDPYYPGSQIPLWNFTYDVLDRSVSELSPNGASRIWFYGNNPGFKSNSINNWSGVGSIVNMIHPQGRVSTNFINELGETIQVQERDVSNNQLMSFQTYNYDPLGDLFKTEDANGNITTALSDGLGLPTSITEPNSGTTQIFKDAIGNLTGTIDSNGDSLSYYYDSLDRLISRTNSAGGTNTYTYDSSFLGSFDSMQSSDGVSTNFKYDSLNRITVRREVISNKTYDMVYGYDNFNRLNKIQFPGTSGFTVGYQFTSDGYPSRVFNFNTNALIAQFVNMNSRGQPLIINYGNGLNSRYTYDTSTGFISSIQTGLGNQVNIQNYQFLYDSALRVTDKIDFLKNVKEKYTYDPLDRLKLVERCPGLINCTNYQSLSYDSIGNITSKSDIGSYSYTSLKPHAVTSISNGGNSIPFTYDQKGNMLSKGTNLFTWRPDGLTSVLKNGATTIVRGYDAQGNKSFERSTNNNTFSNIRFSDGSYEENSLSGFATENIRVYLGGYPVALGTRSLNGSNMGIQYIHTDNLGSIDADTKTNGALINTYRFDPFGFPLQSALSRGDRGFTGHEHLKFGRLIDMKARVYDPDIARFISADTVVPKPFSTQSFNRYSYVWNSPTNFIDINGHEGSGPPTTTAPSFEGPICRTPPNVSQFAGSTSSPVETILNSTSTISEKNSLIGPRANKSSSGFLAPSNLNQKYATNLGQLDAIIKRDDSFSRIISSIPNDKLLRLNINRLNRNDPYQSMLFDYARAKQKENSKEKLENVLLGVEIGLIFLTAGEWAVVRGAAEAVVGSMNFAIAGDDLRKNNANVGTYLDIGGSLLLSKAWKVTDVGKGIDKYVEDLPYASEKYYEVGKTLVTDALGEEKLPKIGSYKWEPPKSSSVTGNTGGSVPTFSGSR